MISQVTFDQLLKLGEQIQCDRSVVSQRSVDICWHWWRVGQALTADPDFYVRGTKSISVETSVRACEALGLSTALSKGKGRPGGEAAVRKAVDTFNRFPDEDDAKKAIEKAGTYHKLSLGTAYGSRLAKSMSVPVSLLDHISKETGIGDKEARRHIANYLRNVEIQEDIVAFIEEQSRDRLCRRRRHRDCRQTRWPGPGECGLILPAAVSGPRSRWHRVPRNPSR